MNYRGERERDSSARRSVSRSLWVAAAGKTEGKTGPPMIAPGVIHCPSNSCGRRNHGWPRFGAVAVLLSLAAFLVSCAAKDPDVEPSAKDHAVDFEQMIDGLASRNAPPGFVSLRPTRAPKIEPPLFGDQPLFPKDYDWDDQSRVLKATQHAGGAMILHYTPTADSRAPAELVSVER